MPMIPTPLILLFYQSYKGVQGLQGPQASAVTDGMLLVSQVVAHVFMLTIIAALALVIAVITVAAIALVVAISVNIVMFTINITITVVAVTVPIFVLLFRPYLYDQFKQHLKPCLVYGTISLVC